MNLHRKVAVALGAASASAIVATAAAFCGTSHDVPMCDRLRAEGQAPCAQVAEQLRAEGFDCKVERWHDSKYEYGLSCRYAR